MPLAFIIDWSGIAAAITALSVLLPVLAKVWLDMRKMKSDYGKVWHGIIARGFIEAAKYGHLTLSDGKWLVSEHARIRYDAIKPKLQTLRRQLITAFGREPTDTEYSWAMEQDGVLQAFMLEQVCPVLGLNSHGCLAIACVVGRENGAEK